MSWSPSCFYLFLCLALPACGFTPIYGQNQNNGHALSDVVIKTKAPKHEGQLLQAALEDEFNVAQASDKKYSLEVDLRKESVPILVRDDGTVQRYRVNFISPYILRNITTGKIVQQGQISKMVDYDVSDANYATYVASEDNLRRGITELAPLYEHRIAAILAKSF